jgi:hypothetical protein
MEEKNIIKIQKKFRKTFLHKKSQEISSVLSELFLTVCEDYDNKLNIEQIEKEFDETTKILRDNLNIKKIQNFLDYLYKVYPEDKTVAKKLTARSLLSAYIMYGYPEISLDFSRKKLKDDSFIEIINYDVYFFSKLLIINITEFINSKYSEEKLRKLVKSINIYSNIFNLFLYQDKLRQINKITFEFYQISKTVREIQSSDSYSDEDKVELTEKLLNTMEGLKEMLKIISPSFDLGNLEFYEKILDRLEQVIHKSYWDKLREEMKEKKDVIIKAKMQEIYDTFKSFSIKKTNEKAEIIQEFINNFHYDDSERWITFGDLCMNIILDLQSPSRNDTTRTKFHDIKYGIYDNIDDLVIKIIECVFQENQIIFKEIYNMKIMASMGINPFVKK